MRLFQLILTAVCLAVPHVDAAPFTVQNLDQLELKVAEQEAQLIVIYEKDERVISENYEQRVAKAETVLTKRGDLKIILILQEAMEQYRASGQVVRPRQTGEPVLDQLFYTWEDTLRLKRNALQRDIRTLYQSYAKHLQTTVRMLTISENIDLAQEADRRRKETLENLQHPDFGAYKKQVTLAPDLNTCKWMIWDTKKKLWHIHPMNAYTGKKVEGGFQVNVDKSVEHSVVKLFLPVSVRAGDVVTLEASGIRSIDLIDTSHSDRNLYNRNREYEDFHTYRIELRDARTPAFFIDGEAVEHAHYERKVEGQERSVQPFDITGFHPGFSMYRGGKIVIRNFEIERNK